MRLIPNRRRLISALRRTFTRHRLLFAAKTALAAGLAWYLAPFMPGPAAAYPYYAPLGALVSMHPTVADSAKHGFQSLLGLSLGIGMAFAVTTFADPSSFSVALVIGLGVLIGGLPRLGTASEWIPMAALFVLLLGDSNAENFSFGYVLQMALGVAVGLTVNWLIIPPLHLEQVDPALEGHRNALSHQLRDMAQAMQESWPPNHEAWASRSDLLDTTAAGVRTAVYQAELSAKANPRSRRRATRLPQDLAGLRTVERLTFHVQDITDVLQSVIWEEGAGTVIPDSVLSNLSEALESVADVIDRWRSDEEPELEPALSEARDCVAGLGDAINEAAAGQASVNAAASVAMSLRRMITVLSSK
ncbi:MULTISPECIES: aromatic acid exporter family protein [Paenarthrobacter]|uniref:Aromatic acid exporter family protein n=1 Tax=Paenarthrobacter ureafaciens TaxID=37931 RepID=A0AAX3EIN4_PAEUR|nr:MULTISPECIES: FUSC family protein [Paenarthrobacter]MDO5862722.1 aromatic acid exporter family protein [Paenarthrobacter sp. SD-2]MDO5873795.1 aromatic acid exporter family protein [Paenarthrobacter sp. SD-1]UYV93236.1 aromatic acid exporter family protein [Paenarthrobacter ureafaciens]UYV97770.1 aromatic acid exporter family protein [Paenarthrobacter ureafaciens]WIV33150.1 aromatic acid exporter family protein [Paenarthrobacter sp. R1]